jgi:uncharacterized protein
MVHKSSVPLFWRLQKHRYALLGSRCTTCSQAFMPPKTFCPECRRSGKIEDFHFSGNGKISSYTIIRIPPEGFEVYTPYTVAVIDLDEGASISGQVIGDINRVEVGKRVRPVFRKLMEDGKEGIIHYGVKFEIVE